MEQHNTRIVAGTDTLYSRNVSEWLKHFDISRCLRCIDVLDIGQLTVGFSLVDEYHFTDRLFLRLCGASWDRTWDLFNTRLER
jgi:hypothetical protein